MVIKLCLVDIWCSKNTKLIRFKSICPNDYFKLRDNDIKDLINLASLDLNFNKIIHALLNLKKN